MRVLGPRSSRSAATAASRRSPTCTWKPTSSTTRRASCAARGRSSDTCEFKTEVSKLPAVVQMPSNLRRISAVPLPISLDLPKSVGTIWCTCTLDTLHSSESTIAAVPSLDTLCSNGQCRKRQLEVLVAFEGTLGPFVPEAGCWYATGCVWGCWFCGRRGVCELRVEKKQINFQNFAPRDLA